MIRVRPFHDKGEEFPFQPPKVLDVVFADVDPDPLFRRGDGGSCPPSWGHQFPELCRGDREGSRWAWKKSVFVFLWPFVVGWRLVHERSGRFRGPAFTNEEKGESLHSGRFGFGRMRMNMSQR